MDLRTDIDLTFSSKAFARPLFYSYPGGLRFELSEGGTAIEQFLLAMSKATEICTDIFNDTEVIPVCLKSWSSGSAFSHRPQLTELKAAGIAIPKQKNMWVEVERGEGSPDDADCWLYLAFEVPKEQLQNLLWCALATGFGSIRPNPDCMVYLFNLQKRIMVYPYDDRGMDVVGPNQDYLATLYRAFGRYLLEYDRPLMEASFSASNSPVNSDTVQAPRWLP